MPHIFNFDEIDRITQELLDNQAKFIRGEIQPDPEIHPLLKATKEYFFNNLDWKEHMPTKYEFPNNYASQILYETIESIKDMHDESFDPQVKAILITKLEEAFLWSHKLIKKG